MKNKKFLIIFLTLVGILGLTLFPLLYTKVKGKLTPVNIQSLTENEKFSFLALNMEDLAKHNSENDCWLLIGQNVYDVTEYIPMHPNRDIVKGCGLDATSMFEGEIKHRGDATTILSDYLIGYLN
jgi:cytochrome b involved in lipid metabolism